jgi:predicted metalloprotease
MPERVRSILLAVCCAALAGGCGSSNRAATSTARVETPARAAGQELSALTKPLAVDAARLPAASTQTPVERKYLIALFDDAQSSWRRDFAAAGLSYTPARVRVYWSKVESPCGNGEDSGPFYCPGDRTVYLDVRFFALLVHKFGVHGVAQAYIVGHEVAHHVQRLLGIARRVDRANEADPTGKNGRSVLVELQADCLAGVWGRSAFPRADVTTRELADATRTADAIGDDYDAEATGDVVDSSLWTHGSSQQRQYWLRKGFQSGRPTACDTFAGR